MEDLYDFDYDYLCDCGKCRSCDSHTASDDDDAGLCERCNGAGCVTCEYEGVEE